MHLVHLMLRDDKFLRGARLFMSENLCSHTWITYINGIDYFDIFINDETRPLRMTQQQAVALVAERCAQADLLMIHFLSNFSRVCLTQVRSSLPCAVQLWGGDYEKFTSARKLLPRTLNALRPSNKIPTLRAIRSSYQALNPVRRKNQRILRELLTQRALPLFLQGRREAERAAIPALTEFRVRYVYDSGTAQTTGDDTPSIILGNSANPTNNHLDALEWIGSAARNTEIVVPLSYGDQAYASKILSLIPRNIYTRIKPLFRMLPAEEYEEIIKRSTHGAFCHLRQQAIGNISSLLKRGKTVMLHSQGVMYKSLTDLGFQVARIDCKMIELPHLDKHQLQHNRSLANSIWSNDERCSTEDLVQLEMLARSLINN